MVLSQSTSKFPSNVLNKTPSFSLASPCTPPNFHWSHQNRSLCPVPGAQYYSHPHPCSLPAVLCLPTPNPKTSPHPPTANSKLPSSFLCPPQTFLTQMPHEILHFPWTFIIKPPNSPQLPLPNLNLQLPLRNPQGFLLGTLAEGSTSHPISGKWQAFYLQSVPNPRVDPLCRTSTRFMPHVNLPEILTTPCLTRQVLQLLKIPKSFLGSNHQILSLSVSFPQKTPN